MAAPDTTRALRADARQNRERLLRAAGEAFATAGPEATMESVAREAGLGIGTLYRHFPTREALIEAVYRDEVGRLCSSADDLLAELPADAALERWMARFVEYAGRKRGLAGALMSIAAAQADLFASTREALLATLARFLAAGRAQGTIRADVEAADVLRSMYAIWAIPEGEDFVGQSGRVMRLLVDGLRHGATGHR
ncbi:MAG TPA: helix-turn-helix domain-containing protein [Solirubrobacteraceae bacterium]|jgi:AcrR family transcriptional regulator